MTFLDLLPLILLGAVLGLDTVSFPQAMISRPLVAATIAGALVGDATRGLLIGASLEFFALETLPFGASRYPEWGSASVIGGAMFASTNEQSAGAFATSILAGLVIAWLGGWSMVQLRKLNARWASRRHEAVARGSRRVVIGLQLYGLTADLMRGALLTGLSLAALLPAQQAALRSWEGDARVARAVVAAAAASVAVGAMWKIFHSTPQAPWLFVGGLAVGIALLSVL